MAFARVTFWIAGLAGLVLAAPLYVLEAEFGRRYPPPLNHPEFYYGFAAVGLAWQLAFLVIGSNPSRYRALMLPAMVEKFAYSGAVFALAWQNRVPSPLVLTGLFDFLFGVLFVFAWLRTPRFAPPPVPAPPPHSVA